LRLDHIAERAAVLTLPRRHGSAVGECG
jgi:hypothetical protein